MTIMQPVEYYKKALRFILSEKKISQKTIADAIDTDPNNVSQFLRGLRNFSDDKRVQIAEYLGTNYVDMLILGRQLAEGPRKVVYLRPQPLNEIGTDLNDSPADDTYTAYPLCTVPDPEDELHRIAQKIYGMTVQAGMDGAKDIQRIAQDRIDKKRMEQEIEELKKKLQEVMEGRE